jgi:heme exporter protein A
VQQIYRFRASGCAFCAERAGDKLQQAVALLRRASRIENDEIKLDMPQLQCENLSCERGGRILFSGLELAMEQGEVCAIGGQNGSGKTSLLEIIAGLLSPVSGKIFWEGHLAAGNANFLQQMVYVGHKNALKLEMTVAENIAHYAALKDTGMLVPAALEYFDLGYYADVPCGELSSGWRRRVALARLIVAPGTLWLLDEPTSSLDEGAVSLLHSLIATRKERGGIVLFYF